jgi:hypothetical protein
MTCTYPDCLAVPEVAIHARGLRCSTVYACGRHLAKSVALVNEATHHIVVIEPLNLTQGDAA